MQSNVYLFNTDLKTFQVDLINPQDKEVHVFAPNGNKILLLPKMKACFYRNSFKEFKFLVGRWFSDLQIEFRVKEIHKDKIQTMIKLISPKK
jgi:hypothetical protein